MTPRQIAFVLLALGACGGLGPVPDGPFESASEVLGRGELVEVRLERRLYEQAGDPHFLVRVRLTNRTDRAVGVDLRDPLQVFYPNQWGGLDEPARGIIDESYAIPRELTPEVVVRLRADFRAGALATIPARGSITYYREFNASGRADVDATDAPYLFVSIRGQLFATDGERVENVEPNEDDSLYLRTPVAWSNVPAGARVIR